MDSYRWCVNCGKPLGERHHVIHRSQGGGDEPENLVPLCRSCHQRHHDEGTLRIEHIPEGIRFTDILTGDTHVFDGTPHVASGPNDLTDAGQQILSFFDLATFAQRLIGQPDEVLEALYEQVREIKYRAWQAQAAIIHEMQSRCTRGDMATQVVAEKLNCSQRTVQRRGQIYREILSDPECADVGVLLPNEAWYQEAVTKENPKQAILYAAERKSEDPTYSIRRFRADMATGEKDSVVEVQLICREGNKADFQFAERLEHSLGVPVRVAITEDALDTAVAVADHAFGVV